MTSNMINYRKYLEDVRHNREMERLTGEQQAEVVLHNRNVEAETYRTNLANEQIKSNQNAINQAYNEEIMRHNTVTEQEQQRHNVKTESISAMDVRSQSLLRESQSILNSANYDLVKEQTTTETKKQENIGADTIVKMGTAEQQGYEKALIKARTAAAKAEASLKQKQADLYITNSAISNSSTFVNTLGGAVKVMYTLLKD